MKEKKGLNAFSVAFMFVGTIMGAGFASGREIWQFFGVFGSKAYIGVIAVGFLFISIGVMTGVIARKLKTNDMGKVIVPGNNKYAINFVGYFMAFILFTVLITMSSAGGALFNQQFGLHRVIGGVIIIFFVIITVIGGFDRVSHVFRTIMPVLILIIILVSLAVIIISPEKSDIDAVPAPSPLAPNWLLSAVIYMSYNVLAVIPIVATAAYNAKSTGHALVGAGLGGVFLAFLAFILVACLNTDPSLSQVTDMPMLAFAGKLSGGINILYSLVLLFAIYASATGNYYGFTLKLKASPQKNKKIIIIAIIGFFFGLIGFKNVVAYMLPLEGFAGLAIVVMIILNFIKVVRLKPEPKQEKL